MNRHQELAIRALEQMKGDDLYRAKAAWRFLTPAQMNEKYGESGKSRNQIIDEYQKHDSEIDAAIAWVKEAKV